jgi:phage baseplate assembly protein W
MNPETTLGRGIVSLHRVGGDLEHEEGSKLVEAAVRQILGTRKGELRWRPGFGLALHRRRHTNITEVFREQINVDVRKALEAFEPRIEVVDVTTEQFEGVEGALKVRVAWRALVVSQTRSVVVTDTKNTEVQI